MDVLKTLTGLALVIASLSSGAAVMAVSEAHAEEEKSGSLANDEQTVRLANGFRYRLAAPDKSGNVSVKLVVSSGITDERSFETGYAHLLEHLQTALFTNADGQREVVWNYLKPRSNNSLPRVASTTLDGVEYVLNVRSGELPSALEIARQISSEANFDSYELWSQKNSVINEMQGKAPSSSTDTLSGLFASMMDYEKEYRNTRAATVASMRDYFHRIYVPESMLLEITGDYDRGATEAAIKERFGTIAAAKRTQPAGKASLDAQILPFVINKKGEISRAIFQLDLAAADDSAGKADYYSLLGSIIARSLETSRSVGDSYFMVAGESRQLNPERPGVDIEFVAVNGRLAEAVIAVSANLAALRARTVTADEIATYSGFCPVDLRIASNIAASSCGRAIDVEAFNRLLKKTLDPERIVPVVVNSDGSQIAIDDIMALIRQPNSHMPKHDASSKDRSRNHSAALNRLSSYEPSGAWLSNPHIALEYKHKAGTKWSSANVTLRSPHRPASASDVERATLLAHLIAAQDMPSARDMEGKDVTLTSYLVDGQDIHISARTRTGNACDLYLRLAGAMSKIKVGEPQIRELTGIIARNRDAFSAKRSDLVDLWARAYVDFGSAPDFLRYNDLVLPGAAELDVARQSAQNLFRNGKIKVVLQDGTAATEPVSKHCAARANVAEAVDELAMAGSQVGDRPRRATVNSHDQRIVLESPTATRGSVIAFVRMGLDRATPAEMAVAEALQLIVPERMTRVRDVHNLFYGTGGRIYVSRTSGRPALIYATIQDGPRVEQSFAAIDSEFAALLSDGLTEAEITAAMKAWCAEAIKSGAEQCGDGATFRQSLQSLLTKISRGKTLRIHVSEPATNPSAGQGLIGKISLGSPIADRRERMISMPAHG